MTWRKSEAFISVMGTRLMMPALFTRMSIGATSDSMVLTASATASSSVTSKT